MPLSGLNDSNRKLILFGGKGGVGKTSCAIATAIELSKEYRTLLISTDPAHSVSDSLEQSIGYQLQQIAGIPNLTAIEIAADEAFSAFKKENEKVLKTLFDTSTNLDNEDIDQLMSLSIPGIDEVMSFKIIVDLIEKGEFDKYVVDTAPTGHVLRLLSSPKLLDEWIKVAARMRWKYRYMITSFTGSYQVDDTDTLLLNLKKAVKRIEKLLSDEVRCEFIPVCIPESMVVKETARLLAELEKYKMTIRQLIVNHVMETETCEFCSRRKAAQQKYLEQLREMYSEEYKLVQVPMLPEEVKGIDALNSLKNILFR